MLPYFVIERLDIASYLPSLQRIYKNAYKKRLPECRTPPILVCRVVNERTNIGRNPKIKERFKAWPKRRL